MTKPKLPRSMDMAKEAQKKVESAADKFDETEQLAKDKKPAPIAIPKASIGRISPQLSCTIAPEDKEKLTSLTLRLSMRKGRALNTSSIIRALIRLGERYEEELDV